MQKITIHIGYHKTGSTLLQKQIFSQADAFYSGPNSDHLRITREMLDDIQTQGFNPKAFRRNVLDIAGAQQRPIILSHEEFSGWPEGKCMDLAYRMADNLHQAFPEAGILCIIRNQMDWIKSLYAYRCSVKGSETRSFTKYLKSQGDGGLFEKMQYDKLIRYYHDLYTPDQCMVIPFEMIKNDADLFFDSIAKFIGINYDRPSRTPVINKSIKSTSQLRLCRTLNVAFNLIYPRYNKIVNPEPEKEIITRYTYYALRLKLANLLSPVLPKKQLQYPKEIEKYLESLFAGSNSKLNQIINTDLSRYGYPVR